MEFRRWRQRSAEGGRQRESEREKEIQRVLRHKQPHTLKTDLYSDEDNDFSAGTNFA